MEAKSTAPTQVINILYVDLIDVRDSITRQLRLPMENGITWGDFELPDTLIAGSYRISAYTAWMRNGGVDSFFDQTIRVVSSGEQIINAKVEQHHTTFGQHYQPQLLSMELVNFYLMMIAGVVAFGNLV